MGFARYKFFIIHDFSSAIWCKECIILLEDTVSDRFPSYWEWPYQLCWRLCPWIHKWAQKGRWRMQWRKGEALAVAAAWWKRFSSMRGVKWEDASWSWPTLWKVGDYSNGSMEKAVGENARNTNLMLIELCSKYMIQSILIIPSGWWKGTLWVARCDGCYFIRLTEKTLLEFCWICRMLFYEIDGKCTHLRERGGGEEEPHDLE